LNIISMENLYKIFFAPSAGSEGKYFFHYIFCEIKGLL
jgi:hypothetical protein